MKMIYKFNDVKKFESKLSYIIELRNKINHYEPIIPFITRLEPNLYNILYSAVNMIANFYSRVSQININVEKPVLLTKVNNYNKKVYNRIIDLANRL